MSRLAVIRKAESGSKVKNKIENIEKKVKVTRKPKKRSKNK